jgi:hypothetical protein
VALGLKPSYIVKPLFVLVHTHAPTARWFIHAQGISTINVKAATAVGRDHDHRGTALTVASSEPSSQRARSHRDRDRKDCGSENPSIAALAQQRHPPREQSDEQRLGEDQPGGNRQGTG